VKAARPVPVVTPGRENNPELRLYVAYTNPDATKSALKAAVCLARDLKARLVLVVPKIVPYPLPLEAPPVSNEYTDRLLSQLLDRQEADITAQVYLCRDPDTAIRDALEPNSIVIIGGHRWWWLSKTWSLARLLKREGHEVIFAGARPIQSRRLLAVQNEPSL
jgi:hypothetical protein